MNQSKNSKTEIIKIPEIKLEWSEWIPWNHLKKDARKSGVIKVPNGMPGIYEAKYMNEEKRLTIGKASNLRYRVKQGLVKGKTMHSSGDKIRDSENTSQIVVRWAITDRPAAVEEELHKKHKKKFGALPQYVCHT